MLLYKLKEREKNERKEKISEITRFIYLYGSHMQTLTVGEEA